MATLSAAPHAKGHAISMLLAAVCWLCHPFSCSTYMVPCVSEGQVAEDDELGGRQLVNPWAGLKCTQQRAVLLG